MVDLGRVGRMDMRAGRWADGGRDIPDMCIKFVGLSRKGFDSSSASSLSTLSGEASE